MPKTQFCERCQVDIPMLDETEWAELEPMLKRYVTELKAARSRGLSLDKATKLGLDTELLRRYNKITGLLECNVMNIWHHRAALYGPPCVECGKPLRNPAARICAYCGYFCEI
jgi:hypothetical protein